MKKVKARKLVLDRSTIRVLVDEQITLARGGDNYSIDDVCDDPATLRGNNCTKLASGCGSAVG